MKENENADSEIIRMGVLAIPLSIDEQGDFEKGKAITPNQDKTSNCDSPTKIKKRTKFESKY